MYPPLASVALLALLDVWGFDTVDLLYFVLNLSNISTHRVG